jgi:hypothetical protein
MGIFYDNELSRNAASFLAEELRVLVKETGLTVEVNQNVVTIHPATGEPFAITCGEPGQYRIRSIGSAIADGFPRQVYAEPPRWANNDLFDKDRLLAEATRWIAKERAKAA